MPIEARQGGVEGFRVQPEELLGAASAARGLAAQILAELQSLSSPAELAATALRACRSGEAVGSCIQAWQSLLTGLAGELDRGGRNLAQTAAVYRAGDSQAAARFAAVGGP
ncbi:hypothetical protein ABT095_18630 [Kitasatospora sp. NPDC002227]|uniref:hypothetical protein n=1 Tax=Kitasatospora sp. NPDC002227 TaxID=3154773 RepID=UPI003331588B